LKKETQVAPPPAAIADPLLAELERIASEAKATLRATEEQHAELTERRADQHKRIAMREQEAERIPARILDANPDDAVAFGALVRQQSETTAAIVALRAQLAQIEADLSALPSAESLQLDVDIAELKVAREKLQREGEALTDFFVRQIEPVIERCRELTCKFPEVLNRFLSTEERRSPRKAWQNEISYFNEILRARERFFRPLEPWVDVSTDFFIACAKAYDLMTAPQRDALKAEQAEIAAQNAWDEMIARRKRGSAQLAAPQPVGQTGPRPELPRLSERPA